MGYHAFSELPQQAARVQSTYPQLISKGIFGVDQGWDIPLALWQAPDGFEAYYPGHAHHTLSFIVGGAPCDRLDGRFAGRRGYADRDTFMLYSGGGTRRYASHGNITLCHAYFQSAHVQHVAAMESNRSTDGLELCDDRIFAHDLELRRLLDQYLSRAVDKVHPPSRLEMDARAILLGVHLLRYHSNRAGRTHTPKGTLNARRMAAVLDYIEEHLAQNISLAALSDIVGLSQRHFCSAFRASAGTSPHSYVTSRRIERAKLLLAGSDSLVEIALECGFGSQQHFTTACRRALGATPGAVRQAARSCSPDRDLQPESVKDRCNPEYLR